MAKLYYEYTKDDLKEINVNNMTLEEIADYLNLSTSKTRIVLIHLGLNNSYLRPKHFKVNQVFDMKVDNFKELLSHSSMKCIAVNNNVTLKAVRDYMLKNNIKINKKKSMYTKRLGTIYDHMCRRCYNKEIKSYKYYGNRGIKICDEWLMNRKQFYKWAFENGYTAGLTIDRIDVNKGYSPDNCRWVTVKEQNNNKRNNRFLTYKGQTLTFAQWEEKLGFYKGALRDRIDRYGWSVIKAIETPVHHKNH